MHLNKRMQFKASIYYHLVGDTFAALLYRSFFAHLLNTFAYKIST